jgi:2-polyprenyl-3-methyl-5-hydroxy-6-metoxy-1,4-benzoquinol methylase
MSKIYLSKKYEYNGKSSLNLSKSQKNAKLEVISNFKKGILKWENNNCRCSVNKDLLICTKDYIGFNVRFVLCLNCGLIRENPRISKDTIEIFYEKHYRDLKNLSFSKIKQINNQEYLEQTYNKEMERGKIIFNYIKKYTTLKTGLIFDFGTGTGGILKSFKDAGFEIYGVDINEDFLNYGVKKGLNLKKGSIDELKNYPKKANLIIASHILEHLHDLENYLKELRECLEEDGYLIVLLPGLMNIQYHEENLIMVFVLWKEMRTLLLYFKNPPKKFTLKYLRIL